MPRLRSVTALHAVAQLRGVAGIGKPQPTGERGEKGWEQAEKIKQKKAKNKPPPQKKKIGEQRGPPPPPPLPPFPPYAATDF